MRGLQNFVAAYFLVAGLLLGASPENASAQSAAEVVRLWPGAAPGTDHWKGPETSADEKSAEMGRNIRIVRKVTEPNFTVVRPPPGKATGAGMIILPGGGFGLLAVDIEGTEVAQWLAERGVTAFVLKYRVYDADPDMVPRITEIFTKGGPSMFDDFAKVLAPRRRIATADALQAVRLIRTNAAVYGVSPDRIGMMGFSAGAMTTFSAVLEADTASRPNFAAPIYGAAPEGVVPTKDAPPLFLVHTQDDGAVPVSKSVEAFQAWQKAGLPAELHIYPTGGHGYGLGKPGTASEVWPHAFEDWLRKQKAVR